MRPACRDTTPASSSPRGEAAVEDLGSKNGTYVRDRRVDAPLTLGDGDQIRLGSVVVTFRIPPVTGSTETAPAG